MADYIFNIYLHTDKSKLGVTDYPLNEYSSDLTPFFFTRNENVSIKINVEILGSYLSCRGSNMFSASAIGYGLSAGMAVATKRTYYSSGVLIDLTSISTAEGSNFKMAAGHLYPWSWAYANPTIV